MPSISANGSPLMVASLANGVSILDLVAHEPGISFIQIQKRTGLAKSSTHQLLSTLCQLGLLHMQSEGRYVLGLRLYELGTLAAQQRSVEREALPFLQGLAEEVQLTCHLGVREGNEAIYLAKVDGDIPIKINTWVGKRLSLHSSSLGKALLAWMAPAELDDLLAGLDMAARTPNTLTDTARLKAHLALVRQRGWAIDDEEDVPTIRCVSAPVFGMRGTVVAAISVVGTILQLDDERLPGLAARVCEVAGAISAALGYR